MVQDYHAVYRGFAKSPAALPLLPSQIKFVLKLPKAVEDSPMLCSRLEAETIMAGRRHLSHLILKEGMKQLNVSACSLMALIKSCHNFPVSTPSYIYFVINLPNALMRYCMIASEINIYKLHPCVLGWQSL